MTEVTAIITSAARRTAPWSKSDVSGILCSVQSYIRESHVDWEPGDEEWGRVLTADGSVAVLVCARFPLAFVSVLHGGELELPADVVCVRVEDMGRADLVVEKRVLEDAFGRKLSDNVDYAAISVLDLWWATI